MGVEEYVQSVIEGSPWYVTLPARPVARSIMALKGVKKIIRHFLMKPLASGTPDSTLYWFSNNLNYRISAFFNSRETWQQIPESWDDIRRPNYEDYQRLHHGYDESLADAQLDIEQMRKAASFRGGQCLSAAMAAGELMEKLQWQCWRGHQFTMTANAVLKGGHWCPECEPARRGWDYDEEARHNPFFAQVWYTNHDKDEANFYSRECYLDVVGSPP
jgi:hypothetical protein